MRNRRRRLPHPTFVGAVREPPIEPGHEKGAPRTGPPLDLAVWKLTAKS